MDNILGGISKFHSKLLTNIEYDDFDDMIPSTIGLYLFIGDVNDMQHKPETFTGWTCGLVFNVNGTRFVHFMIDAHTLTTKIRRRDGNTLEWSSWSEIQFVS